MRFTKKEDVTEGLVHPETVFLVLLAASAGLILIQVANVQLSVRVAVYHRVIRCELLETCGYLLVGYHLSCRWNLLNRRTSVMGRFIR